MRYSDFKLIDNIIDSESVEYLSNVRNPETLLKHRVVKLAYKVKQIYIWFRERVSKRMKTLDSLDNLTIGEYLLLTSLSGEKLVYTVFETLYGLLPAQVDRLETEDVFGTLNFVRSEVNRINKLFESTRILPRPEEERAGVKQLCSTGTFSVIDYISKRQRITIEQAEKMKWKVVFALMMIDKESEEYKRRLEQEYRKKK